VVPDAFIAAIAIEHDAVLVSNDRALSRFPELRLEAPRS
jgi:predicted nucleic acid-binding protein